MRKLLLVAAAAATGATFAYLFDPDRGRSRRARLSDQAAARARDAAETVRAGVEYQKGVVEGVVHDVTEPLRPPRTYDDATLLQKIRSEALGYLAFSDSIEVEVSDGNVRIEGPVDSEQERRRLIELIDAVDGVNMIEDHLEYS